jgi:MFS family permease
MYLMMPITFTVLTRYPGLRHYCGHIGLLIAAASLITSGFATHIWQLLVCQGILCAIGSGLFFAPTTLYLDEWFIARKGIAYGTLWAGKTLAKCVLPFLMSLLLSRFGASTTLRIWAISPVIIISPLLVALKPRIPLSAVTARRPLDWRFLQDYFFLDTASWQYLPGPRLSAIYHLSCILRT